jgi:hypothetical protein
MLGFYEERRKAIAELQSAGETAAPLKVEPHPDVPEVKEIVQTLQAEYSAANGDSAKKAAAATKYYGAVLKAYDAEISKIKANQQGTEAPTSTTPAASTNQSSTLVPPMSQKIKDEIRKNKEEWDSRVGPGKAVELFDIEAVREDMLAKISPELKAYGESLPDVEPYKSFTFLGKLWEALELSEAGASGSQQQTSSIPSQQAISDAVAEFPLAPYDEICLYGGYLDRLREATTTDIDQNRLLRKGVWTVDTITVSGSTPTGIIITVQCRDRLKYLMDTFGSYNTAESSEFLTRDSKEWYASARTNVILNIARRGIGHLTFNGQEQTLGGRFIQQGTILDIPTAVDGQTRIEGFDPYFMYKNGETLFLATGSPTANPDGSASVTTAGPAESIDLSTPEGVKKAEEKLQEVKEKARAQLETITDEAEKKAAQEVFDRINALQTGQDLLNYIKNSPNQNSVLGTDLSNNQTTTAQLGGSLRGSVVNGPLAKEMKFNIVSGRVPYATGADSYFGSNFIVADRVPLDYIKFLSQQEPWPTEVFQDSRTGEFWYAPRGLDLSGLSDRNRFYRTYYFRNWPSDLVAKSDAAQASKKALAAVQAQGAELATYDDLISKITKASAEIKQYEDWLNQPFGEDAAEMTQLYTNMGNIISTTKSFVYENSVEDSEPRKKMDQAVAEWIALAPVQDKGVFVSKSQAIRGILTELQDLYKQEAEAQRQTVSEQKNELTAATGAAPGFTSSAPHLAQMIHTFREEVSNVSVRTNIIVQTHSPASPENIQQILHLTVQPWFMRGRAYPTSFFTVTDDTAGTVGGGGKSGALIALAMAYARVIAKELRVAAATILGDPSFVPGEVIQVIGSPMNPDALKPESAYSWDKDRVTIVDMNRQYEILGNELAVVAQNDKNDWIPTVDVVESGDGASTPKLVATQAAENGKVDLNTAISNVEKGINYITFKREPPSIWRVEGVVDRFMDGVPGYYTELALLSCF